MPPRWIVEPTDVSVERNRHTTLHCQAQGVPMPTIVWKKATGETQEENQEYYRSKLPEILAYLPFAT